MTRLLLAATLMTLMAGCGVAPVAGQAPASAMAAAASVSFAELKDVKVVAGAPSDWWEKTTRRYVSAKTVKNGTVWVLDDKKGTQVLHNTQQVTSAKKIAQVATALERAAEQARDADQAAQLREFIALLRTVR